MTDTLKNPLPRLEGLVALLVPHCLYVALFQDFPQNCDRRNVIVFTYWYHLWQTGNVGGVLPEREGFFSGRFSFAEITSRTISYVLSRFINLDIWQSYMSILYYFFCSGLRPPITFSMIYLLCIWTRNWNNLLPQTIMAFSCLLWLHQCPLSRPWYKTLCFVLFQEVSLP